MSRYQFVFHLVISLSVMSAFARAESIRYSSSLPTTPFQAVNAGKWVTYTFDGPNLSTGILLPTNVFEMARSTGGTAIGLKGSNTSEIWNVNLANRTLQVISDSANPEISWPSGITYDPLRDHFYLSTLGGTGYIYTYNQYLNSWSALSNLNNLDSTSISYSPYFDRIYVIAGDAGTLGNPQLLEFDPDTGILLRYPFTN